MGEPAISTEGLTKDYGHGRGVFDLSLEVAPGEVFGLIGPNGAGKTTTIRLLMDFIRPDRGTAHLLGLDARSDSIAIKRRVGYLPGELPSYPGATVAQILGLLAAMRGGVDEGFIRDLASRLQLDLHRRYRDLSHGNKQKVWLVQAFMHRPKLLILDEPTLGLDPLIQAEFKRLVSEATAGGTTVFLSSHVLSEVQSLCSRIGLVNQGRLIRVGTLAQLRELRIHRVEVTVEHDLNATALARLPGVSEVSVDDHRLRCTVRGPFAPLVAALDEAKVLELDSEELSLEELFLATYATPPA
ncbi:MAG TPA: ABC transporter ATP-binding protein [Candidatus Sulfotelmatobacter sp.]|nr:ABC transporter ATP-binding protein [Candidatus Sulfotelmatobacter sp.]